VSDPRTQPVEIDLERTKHLEIRWADGHQSTIALLYLRNACPCASCRQTRLERVNNSSAVIPSEQSMPDMMIVERAELVGAYGLKIVWNDGHDTGIYDFALLRELGG